MTYPSSYRPSRPRKDRTLLIGMIVAGLFVVGIVVVGVAISWQEAKPTRKKKEQTPVESVDQGEHAAKELRQIETEQRERVREEEERLAWVQAEARRREQEQVREEAQEREQEQEAVISPVAALFNSIYREGGNLRLLRSSCTDRFWKMREEAHAVGVQRFPKNISEYEIRSYAMRGPPRPTCVFLSSMS